MNAPEWYYAKIRWGMMVEGKEGLRSWQEQVHIFPSENRETAFQHALQIGRAQEQLYKEGRRLIAKRLAQVVVLDRLGEAAKGFQVDLGMKKAQEQLPYNHVFNPEGTEPEPFF